MGWTSQYFTTIIIEGNSPQTGIFIYGGAPGAGNLIGSWAAQGGTDPYGNVYPTGINVFQGQLSGVSIINGILTSASLVNAVESGSTLTNSTFHGGQVIETQIIFDSNGGVLLNYAQTTTVVTLTTANSSWTAPAGNYSTAKVECWGSGAGGGGGNVGVGGEAGGGGEYAQEPTYPISPGAVYGVAVPSGGTGGSSGNAGNFGGLTIFDTSQITGGGVFANGGNAGSGGNGGLGGSGSANTIHFNGGNGGSNPGQAFTGAASGGNSANSSAAGNNGNNASSSTGAASPSAQTGSGTGGAGGNSGANGSNGTLPGAGGGGAGSASSIGSVTKSYKCTNTYSYYGSQVGNGRRNINGSMYQGCASGDLSLTGDQYSFALMPYSQIQSDLSGATINSVKIALINQHSWYNSGCYVILGYAPFSSFGGTGNPSGATENAINFFIDEGQLKTQDVTGYGFGTAFQNGTARSLMLGPSAATSGGATDLWNYGYFTGGANAVTMTINYTPSGSSTEVAGTGGAGQIKITYQTAISLESAISPQAGSDSSSNAYAAGFTGPVQNFHPGSSPTTVEAWQNITPPTGWSGTLRYKLMAEFNFVFWDMALTHTALTAKTNVVLTTTLPTIYRPTTSATLPCTESNNTAFATPTPALFVGSGGTVTAFNIDVGATGIDTHAMYALN